MQMNSEKAKRQAVGGGGQGGGEQSRSWDNPMWIKVLDNQELPGCDGRTAVTENCRKELYAGAHCGHFEIAVLTRQRHLCGLTKSSEDKCRRLTCPIEEKWI